uniref:Mitochondrial import receptor subunit TOM6 homolog n=1 Tax=Balaenoptera musculus TaxID=9771 RepID=A0A8C0CHE8_BALMU
MLNLLHVHNKKNYKVKGINRFFGRCVVRGLVEHGGAAIASSGAGMTTAGLANEAPEIPDNVGDWLRGVYRFATGSLFQRNLILNLGLFAAGVWLARNLSDIDLMAPQPGV